MARFYRVRVTWVAWLALVSLTLLPQLGRATTDLMAGCPARPGEDLEAGSGLNASEGGLHTEEEEEECKEEVERAFDSTVRIARLEFHRVETIFIILMFIMVVVLAKMCECTRPLQLSS